MPETNGRPLAPALPTTLQEWKDKRKVATKRTLNDMVEELHWQLCEDDNYSRFLYAVWDEQAIEGSLAADNYEAANMIRVLAKEKGSPVALEKKATIAKALGVVLRRYGEDRPARRHTVDGQVVPHPENNG